MRVTFRWGAMPIADRWIPGLETGVSPLLLTGGALALGIAIVALVMMVRRRKSVMAVPRPEPVASAPIRSGSGLAWPIAFVIGCLFVGWGIAVRPAGPDSGARQAVDNRAAELTLRVLVPGSPLACLDAVGSTAIEASCEKTLFSSPEVLAAAIAYVDARLSLFIESSESGRTSGAGDSFERLRRAIEQDRYGLVAHVLTTRGCSADNCATLKLMRDPAQVQANLKDRAFEANVVLHAASWHSDGPSVASASAAALASGSPTAASSGATAPSPPTPSAPSKFEFPSSASIPAVSIMNAEPAQPPAAAKAEQPPPAAKPAATPRRSSARETTSQAQPGAPVQITPEAPPAPAGTLANPGGPPR